MICLRDLIQMLCFFAEDTSLFSVVREPRVTTKTLNEDLSKVWKMLFNPNYSKQA